MRDKESIVRALVKRLNDQSMKKRSVSILSGPWGCGKTYLWFTEFMPALDESKIIYFSLFGLESISTLKEQLMNKSLLLKIKKLRTTENLSKIEVIKETIKNLFTDSERKALLKIALKGTDLAIGTNILPWSYDPLELIDDNLIICLDDVERMPPKVDLEELFGLVNYLAEQKCCKVLLIMNEDEFSKNENYLNANIFLKYKERLIDYHIKIDADIESCFEFFSNPYKEDTFEVYNTLMQCKPQITEIMLKSNCQNLRVLKKSIELIVEILSEKTIILPTELVSIILAFQIEDSGGELLEKDFYDFNQLSLMVSLGISRDKKEPDKLTEMRNQFLNKYFRDSSNKYSFIESFYDRVKCGYYNWEKLKNEINPEPPHQNSIDSLLGQQRELSFFSDKEFSEWIHKVEETILSDQQITTSQLIALIIQLKDSIYISKGNLDSNVDKRIKERLRLNALSGDSFPNNYPLITARKEIWESYFEGYQETVDAAILQNTISDIKNMIIERDINSFTSLLNTTPQGLKAGLSKASLSALREVFGEDRRFFYETILAIKEALSYSSTLKDQISLIHEFITDMLEKDNLDNSANHLLNLLLK
ncbi:MAG: P-loop NTPase fold protein [Desulfamplus sp.]